MAAKKDNVSTVKGACTALGLAIGLVFGGILGLMAGNIILFTGGGMLLGLSIGAALERRSRKDNS
jgi:hypothetical protein